MDIIITSEEIQSVLPKVQGAEHSIVSSQMRHQEEGLFRVWLGLDWYSLLKANLNVYTDVSPFIEKISYSSGAVVRWYGKLYSCSQNTDGTQSPGDTDYWSLAPKFLTAANNTLYDLYLKEVIAWAVFQSTVVYDAIRVTGLGVKRQGDSEKFKDRSVTMRELGMFKKEIGADMNLILQNMDRYLRDNSSLFPDYKPNRTDEAKQVGSHRKNFGFTF